MHRIILWLAIWGVIVGVNFNEISGQESTGKYFPSQLSTTKIKDETKQHYWRKVTVEINQPLSDRRLRAMANAIKRENTRDFDRMWIWFQFPEPMSNRGAWATVTFEGDRIDSIQFSGPTRQQILDGWRFKDDPVRDVRQVWLSFDSPERIVFFVKDDLFYFERRYLSNLSGKMTTVKRISASSLPLKSWKRFMSEDDNEKNEVFGYNQYWMVDDDNILKRMDGDKLAFAAYPTIPGESRFPTVQVERVSEDDLCKQNIQCWGRRHEISAKAPCIVGVEYVLDGVTSYEWTDGWLESKFPRFIWKPGKKEEGILIYLGDSMKVQNAYGGWVPVRYECDFDPSTQKVLDVRVKQ